MLAPLSEKRWWLFSDAVRTVMRSTDQLLTRLGYREEDIVRGEEAALKPLPACTGPSSAGDIPTV